MFLSKNFKTSEFEQIEQIKNVNFFSYIPLLFYIISILGIFQTSSVKFIGHVRVSFEEF